MQKQSDKWEMSSANGCNDLVFSGIDTRRQHSDQVALSLAYSQLSTKLSLCTLRSRHHWVSQSVHCHLITHHLTSSMRACATVVIGQDSEFCRWALKIVSPTYVIRVLYSYIGARVIRVVSASTWLKWPSAAVSQNTTLVPRPYSR